jgi:hypothetical protein
LPSARAVANGIAADAAGAAGAAGASSAGAGAGAGALGESTRRPALDAQSYRANILKLNRCYETGCGLGDSFPRERSDGAGLLLKAELMKLAAVAEAEDARDPELAAIAREQMANPDGHVKEAALRLMATQEPSLANRDAILANVVADRDDSLIAPALLELRRYDLERAPEIHLALIGSMARGAPYVALAIARQIEPFVNDASYSLYTSSLGQLSSGTLAYEALRSALEQYRRHRTGA